MRSFTTEYIPQGSKDPRHWIRHGQPSSSSNANHCKEKVMQTSHVTYYEHMDLWLNCSFSIGQPVLLVRIFTTSPTAHRCHWQGHWQMMRRLLSWRQMTEFLISAFLKIHVTIFFMMDFCFCLMKTLLCQHQLDQRLQFRFYFFVNSMENALMHPCTSYFQLALEAELDTTNTTSPLPCPCIGERSNISQRIYHNYITTKSYLGRFSDWVLCFWDKGSKEHVLNTVIHKNDTGMISVPQEMKNIKEQILTPQQSFLLN